MAFYEDFSKVYDEVMDDSLYEKWLALSERHFSPNTKNILEMACGSGILSQMLVAKNYNVTGLDISHEMLELTKKRVPEISLIEADMRDLTAKLNGKKFDAVTCYSDSICYLSNLTEVKNVFDSVYDVLDENGIFVFDVHSTYQTDIAFPGFSYHDNAEDFAFVWDTYAGDFPHSIVHELTFFVKESDGKFTRKDEVHEERTYEIKEYLTTLAKFDKVSVFADFEDEKPEENSARWFFVCQK